MGDEIKKVAEEGIKQTQVSVDKLSTEIDEAIKKKQSENRIADARMEIVDLYLRSGDITSALDSFEKIGHKALSSLRKFDFLLTISLLSFSVLSFNPTHAYLKELETITDDVDFERRNELSLIMGLDCVRRRDFTTAIKHLRRLLATYSDAMCKIMPYTDYVRYTVLSFILAEGEEFEYRGINEFMEDPDVQFAISKNPLETELLNGFCKGVNREVLRTIVSVGKSCESDFLLKDHTKLVTRMIRAKVYKIYLTPFKKALLASMAHVFDVPEQTLVEDIFGMAAANDLRVKIDAVDGTIWLVRSNPEMQHREDLRELINESAQTIDKLDALVKHLSINE